MSHTTQNRSIWRRSSQPISWLGTEETETNNASKHHRIKLRRVKLVAATNVYRSRDVKLVGYT